MSLVQIPMTRSKEKKITHIVAISVFFLARRFSIVTIFFKYKTCLKNLWFNFPWNTHLLNYFNIDRKISYEIIFNLKTKILRNSSGFLDIVILVRACAVQPCQCRHSKRIKPATFVLSSWKKKLSYTQCGID